MIANTAFGTTICNYMEHKKPKKAILTIYTTHYQKTWRTTIVETKCKTLCKKCLDFCLKIQQVVIEV